MTREQECTHLLHTAIKQAEAKAKERNRELEHQLISARERAQTAEDKIVGLVSELRRASLKEHDWQGRLRKVEQERDMALTQSASRGEYIMEMLVER